MAAVKMMASSEMMASSDGKNSQFLPQLAKGKPPRQPSALRLEASARVLCRRLD